MKKTNKKFFIEGSILDKIANSLILSEKEKLNFLKYIGYLTKKEQEELATLV